MRKSTSLKFITCFVLIAFYQTALAVLPLPTNLISLNSSTGKQLLEKSDTNYLPFVTQSITQENQGYCSVASSVIVFNALNIPAPVDPLHTPYAYFTQNNFFTASVRKMISEKKVRKKGMTLAMLQTALNTFPVITKIFYGNKISVEKFRSIAKNALHFHQAIIINFDRAVLHEVGHGHFSPLIAYNAATDRFLVLDVARYKYAPYWAKTTELFQAIQGIDNDSGKSRGFIIIAKIKENLWKR